MAKDVEVADKEVRYNSLADVRHSHTEDDTMPLTQLIYTSTAVEPMSDESLTDILQCSVQKNRLHGITGMLLYRRGTFLQVLEGRAQAVDETYDRIAKDNRHIDLNVIEHSPILRRSFGDWSMGFRHCDDLKAVDLPGYTNFLGSGFRATELIQDPNFAKAVLQKFAREIAVGQSSFRHPDSVIFPPK